MANEHRSGAPGAPSSPESSCGYRDFRSEEDENGIVTDLTEVGEGSDAHVTPDIVSGNPDVLAAEAPVEPAPIAPVEPASGASPVSPGGSSPPSPKKKKGKKKKGRN